MIAAVAFLDLLVVNVPNNLGRTYSFGILGSSERLRRHPGNSATRNLPFGFVPSQTVASSLRRTQLLGLLNKNWLLERKS